MQLSVGSEAKARAMTRAPNKQLAPRRDMPFDSRQLHLRELLQSPLRRFRQRREGFFPVNCGNQASGWDETNGTHCERNGGKRPI